MTENFKIYIKGDKMNREIQEEAFKKGFRWSRGNTVLNYLDQNQECGLFFSVGSRIITFARGRGYFSEVPNKEVTPEAFLSKEELGGAHIHAKLIKQWADGAEIQAFRKGKWVSCKNPQWGKDVKYRVKVDNSKAIGKIQKEIKELVGRRNDLNGSIIKKQKLIDVLRAEEM